MVVPIDLGLVKVDKILQVRVDYAANLLYRTSSLNLAQYVLVVGLSQIFYGLEVFQLDILILVLDALQ